jgi:hypothetical protein
MLSRQFHCARCGSFVGYRSRRRGWLEKYLLPPLLLRPVRCGDCFRRTYHLIFVPVRERDQSHLTNQAVA